MSGKGDKRRPGKNYAENWDKIFNIKKRTKTLDELSDLEEELFPNHMEMCGECWIKFNSVKCTFKCNVKKGNEK